MDFNRRQPLVSNAYRSSNLIRLGPTQPVVPDEQDEESTGNDVAKEGPVEVATVSESKPLEARGELATEQSNPVPRLGKRKRRNVALKEEIADLKRQLGLGEETIAELRPVEARLKGHIKGLQAYYKERLNRLATEKEDQEDRFRILEEELDTEIQTLTEEKEDCEEQLRKAQEHAFRQMKAGKWVPREDSSIRNWARTHSCADLRGFESLSSEEISQVEGMLHEGICASNESLVTAINRWPVNSKAPMLLVHAVIAKVIFQKIFNRPFYLLHRNPSATGRDPPSFGTNLESLYAWMQHIGHQDAHVWRSQTLRLLRSPKHDPGVEQEVENWSIAVCNVLAKSLLDGPVSKLCTTGNTEEQEKREQDLINLFVDAGALAQELWTQRTYMEIVDKRGLEGFEVDSPIMAAHRLQKLDEDDYRLDGHEIVAVIQPALVAYGNDDGENYEDHKVWSKAIVLVAE